MRVCNNHTHTLARCGRGHIKMSRTSEYRKPTLETRQSLDPGSQMVVTVESVFDGGFVAFYQDSTGNEYRGALLGVDKSQTFG